MAGTDGYHGSIFVHDADIFGHVVLKCNALVGCMGERLKRLASAVQLRPWPPSFQSTCMTYPGDPPVRSQSAPGRWHKEINAYVHVLEELILNCLAIQSAVSTFLSFRTGLDVNKEVNGNP
jgi:hypothetical protein